jgi:hypothetical protein
MKRDESQYIVSKTKTHDNADAHILQGDMDVIYRESDIYTFDKIAKDIYGIDNLSSYIEQIKTLLNREV